MSRFGPELVLNQSFLVFHKKIERTRTVGPLEPVTVRSGFQSLSGPMNWTLKHYSLYLVMFPCTLTSGSDIHYLRSIHYPQLSPSLSSCTPCISACVNQDEQLPYHTTLCGFGFHHICSVSDSSPIRVRLLQQVCGSCFIRTLSATSISFVCVFPSFLPLYSDWVRVRVSFLSLSQFYGCWNPQAPVFIVSLFCLLTQRCSGTSASPYNTNQDQTRQEMVEAAAARLTGQQGNEGLRLACLEPLAVCFFPFFFGTLLISI